MATRPVLVVTGAGGMGVAIAARLGPGKTILLAEHSQQILDAAVAELRLRGHTEVHALKTDVSNADSVRELAESAKKLGSIETVVHTAGIAPAGNKASSIYHVNLLGTALVIDAFENLIAPGGSMLCVASIAGHMTVLPPEEAKRFGLGVTGPDLLQSPLINLENDHRGQAYMMSKAANIQRVKAKARAFGSRGVRINSISPGLIATPMGRAELESAAGDQIRAMVVGQAVKRIGTVDEVVDAVAFLTGPTASYITGTDLIIDGGAVAEEATKGFLATQ